MWFTVPVSAVQWIKSFSSHGQHNIVSEPTLKALLVCGCFLFKTLYQLVVPLTPKAPLLQEVDLESTRSRERCLGHAVSSSRQVFLRRSEAAEAEYHGKPGPLVEHQFITESYPMCSAPDTRNG